jgi:acetyl-CoA C-acetyltransferase
MSKLPKIVICAAARTPIGSIGGAMESVLARNLAITTVKGTLASGSIDPKVIDYTTLGWVMQDPRSPNIAKTVSEMVGCPTTSPGTTVHENCASGGAAIHDITRRLLLGEIKVGIAGGVESMSNTPRYMYTGRHKGQLYGDLTLVDGMMAALTDTTVGKKGELMGLLTERLVKKYNVTREQQDEIACRSHANAVKAWDEGFFDYVLPVEIPSKKNPKVVTRDEGPKSLPLEFFAKQKAFFMPDGGTITPGNSSSLNDAGAAVVLSTEEHAKSLGLPILAELRTYGNIGVPKELMGEGAYKIIPKLFEQANIGVADVDFFDINEAFAAVVGGALADVKGLKIDNINVWGSGISLGHPVGCTGARQVVDMVHQLGKRGKTVGMTTRCVGGGIGSGEVIIKM